MTTENCSQKEKRKTKERLTQRADNARRTRHEQCKCNTRKHNNNTSKASGNNKSDKTVTEPLGNQNNLVTHTDDIAQQLTHSRENNAKIES